MNINPRILSRLSNLTTFFQHSQHKLKCSSKKKNTKGKKNTIFWNLTVTIGNNIFPP